MENIFAQYPIVMPIAFQDSIKKFVGTGGYESSKENAPFARQVDFWFFSLCYAFNKGLTPVKEKDTYNAVQAEILSRDPSRIGQIQLIALSVTKNPETLKNPREMLDIAISLANAGIPNVLSILQDTDSTPLWNLFSEVEELSLSGVDEDR